MDLGGSAASLLHMAAAPATTSPRRVSIPVLVRDGKPCYVIPYQQQASQQTTRTTVMPSSADCNLVTSAPGYAEGPSTAFGVTTNRMPPAAVAYYPSYSGSTGIHTSHSPSAAATAFHQASSVNDIITNLSLSTAGSTTSTSAAVMNSLNGVATSSVSSDPCIVDIAAKYYGQSRWW